MRLPVAWANIAHSNNSLKILTATLLITTALTSSALALMSTKKPLIVERSCSTNILNTADAPYTDDEVKTFLKEGLAARFNSSESNLHLLSIDEVKRRVIEQKAFAKQSIQQRVLIEERNISLNDNFAIIEADRLISLGKVRSALLFKLKVFFAKTTRSRLNPFGIVITKITEVEEQKEEQ